MAHKLTIIGYLSMKRAYLDVELEEAILRYCVSEDIERSDFSLTPEIVEFEDELSVYDAWE